MNETEASIIRLLFPPNGNIPLERMDLIDPIRKRITELQALASGSLSLPTTDRVKSDELNRKIADLREHPPEGKLLNWRQIGELCGLTASAARKRYDAMTRGKIRIVPKARAVEEPTIRESLTVEEVPPAISESEQPKHFKTEPLQEAEPANPEKPPEQEKKPDEVATIRESRNVPLDPETLTEVDRMLGEGIGVLDITAALEKKGTLVPWTKIRSRVAYLARIKKGKEAKPEPKKYQEAEATETRHEPVSISRKELDIMIWDLWRAGKTLDEISDILYNKGLYYSAKSVRIRLLQQGAKL